MMDQLTADNDHLRKQLRELQQRFKELEQARRRRGQFKEGRLSYKSPMRQSPDFKTSSYEEKTRDGGMVSVKWWRPVFHASAEMMSVSWSDERFLVTIEF